MRYKFLILGLTTFALAIVAQAASACPVCFGDSDDPIVKGLEASILFMVGVTYFVIGGGVGGFLLLRRRARLQSLPRREPAADPEDGAQTV